MKMLSLIVSLLLFVTGYSTTVQNKNGKTPQESSSLTVTQAIAKVNFGLFPTKPGMVHGRLGQGGPDTGVTFPATFQTKARKSGKNAYEVTLFQRWTVNKVIPEYHYWTYKVTRRGVVLLTEGGDFPPQEVRAAYNAHHLQSGITVSMPIQVGSLTPSTGYTTY